MQIITTCCVFVGFVLLIILCIRAGQIAVIFAKMAAQEIWTNYDIFK
jgi:hypothetical protein